MDFSTIFSFEDSKMSILVMLFPPFVEERLNEIQTLKYHEEFSHCNKCSTNKGWDCNSKEVTSAFYLVGIVALGSRVRKFVVPDHGLYPSEPLPKALG